MSYWKFLLAVIVVTFSLTACSNSGSSQVPSTVTANLNCTTAGGLAPTVTCTGTGGLGGTATSTNPSVSPTMAAGTPTAPASTMPMTNASPTASSMPATTNTNPGSQAPQGGGGQYPQGITVVSVTVNGQQEQAFAYNGLTLYYFNKDQDTGVNDLSHCPYNGINPNCTQDWVPAMAAVNDPQAPLVTGTPATAPANWSQFTRGQNNPNCPNCEVNGVTPDQYNQLAFNGHPAYYYVDATGACGQPADTPGTANGAGLSCDPGGYAWYVIYTNITSANGPQGPQ
jgi:hypothetical protein